MAKTGTSFDWVSREKIDLLLSELGNGERDAALLAGKNYCKDYSYEIKEVSPRRVRLSLTSTREGRNGRSISFIRSSLKGNREKTDLLDFGNGFYASFEGPSVYVTDGTVIAKASVPNTEAGGIGEIEEIYLRVPEGEALDSFIPELARAYSSVFGEPAPALSGSRRESVAGRPFDQLFTRSLVDSPLTYWLRADRGGICILEARAQALDYSASEEECPKAPRLPEKTFAVRGTSGRSKGYDCESSWDCL